MTMTVNCYLTFESSVNSEGIETKQEENKTEPQFESSVNSEGIETLFGNTGNRHRLRAV